MACARRNGMLKGSAHSYLCGTLTKATAQVAENAVFPLAPAPFRSFSALRGVIGFAPGPLQYMYPSNGASMKGRPEA
jgi:hypothetical protein